MQMKDEYEKLIKQRSLSKWAETLAILLTYAKADFPRLCCSLAERLHRSSMSHAATICYICASNVRPSMSPLAPAAHDAQATPQIASAMRGRPQMLLLLSALVQFMMRTCGWQSVREV